MRKAGLWRSAIVFVLIVQLACPISVFSARASAENSPAPLVPRLVPASPDSSSALVAKALANPLMETVQSLGRLPTGTVPTATDPTLDADPFFLRSQSWVVSTPSNNGDEELAFATDNSSLTLSLGRANRAWHLRAPLHPVYATGEWVVLVANDASFFSRVGAEGIFFVRVEELSAAAENSSKVPVWFFPLPDTGWTGAVQALEFPELQRLVVVDNTGQGLPLDEEDIESIVGIGKMNLSMAMGAGTRVAALASHLAASKILPPRGSTAGFGLLFTGLDWDHPELNVFQTFRGAWWQKAKRDATETLRGWLLPEARADEDDGDIDDSMLLHNLLWAGTVTGVMLAASIVLKYTVFHDYFAERHAGEAPRTPFGAVKREGRDIGDVFAHTLTLGRQLPKVWFGKGIEFFTDSWFPRLNGSRNNLIKRFLDWSVYYSAQSASHVPVNLRTLALQLFVLGGVDTVSYSAQLYFVVPWLAKHIAQEFPGLQERVAEEMATGNPQLNEFRRNEVLGNLIGHLTDPAIATDLKDYYSATLLPQVEEELQARGMKLDDPDYATARKQLLEKKVQERLAKYGFPGNKDFLYDAATLWDFITQKILGYKSGQLKAEMGGKRYVGEDHPGLVGPAIKAALGQARARLAKHPGDPALASAVTLLEKAHHEVSYLKSFARYPTKVLWDGMHGRGPPALGEVVGSVRRMRQLLVALTFEGPVEPALKEAPSEWVKAVGEPGARMAGEIFRRCFFGFANGHEEYLRAPTASEREKVADRAVDLNRQALDELAANHASEIDSALTEGSARERLAARYPGELEFLKDKAYTRAITDKIDADTPYSAPRHGWYRRRQEARAKSRALDAYTRRYGHGFNPGNESERAAYTELYSTEMMHEVSLYPDYEAAPGLKEKVEARAQQELKIAIEEPKAKAYLATLTPEQRVDFVATLYAERVTHAYVDVVTTSDLPATSTAQPGRFQHLRQTRFVRESGFLTRAVRTVESLFPVEAHQTGFASKLYRNVPGLYDLAVSNIRAYRNLATSALAVYPFTKYVWGVALPPHLFLLAVATGFVSATPVAILNRFFQMQGFRPLASIKNMFLYSLAKTWVDFGDLLPDMVLEKDFHRLVGAVESKVGAVKDAAIYLATPPCRATFGQLK